MFQKANKTDVFVHHPEQYESNHSAAAEGKKAVDRRRQNIKLARLRRRLSTVQVAERAGIGRSTLWQIEKGRPPVAFGAYFQVLFAPGLEKGFLQLAADDEFDRKLQDAGLMTKARAPKRKSAKMAINNKTIYVYAHWTRPGEPKLMGLLSATFICGKEVFSFVYDEAWLKAGHTESSGLCS